MSQPATLNYDTDNLNPQTDDEQIKTKKFGKLGNSNELDAQ